MQPFLIIENRPNTENRTNSVLAFNGTDKIPIAKYEDEQGEYVFDWKLQKKYLADCEYYKEKKKTKVKEVKSKSSRKKGRFTFFTTIYDNEGWGPGRSYEKTFKADTFEEANEKLEKHYGQIFDCELISAYDAEGRDINPF